MNIHNTVIRLPDMVTNWQTQEYHPNMPKKMQRKILNISLRDRVPNKKLHSLSSNTDVLERATKLKWKWGGHVARLHPERWATMWDPYMGRRSRGRPRRRWADILIAGAGKLWSREAKDRTKWKKLGKEQLKMLN